VKPWDPARHAKLFAGGGGGGGENESNAPVTEKARPSDGAGGDDDGYLYGDREANEEEAKEEEAKEEGGGWGVARSPSPEPEAGRCRPTDPRLTLG
jgi:hypothetical protein